MNIISRFVREQKRYTKKELQQLFLYNDQQVRQFLKNLKSYGVLKSVKYSSDQKELSNLVEEDLVVGEETSENEAVFYVFTYVGVITIGSRILKIYPKYIESVSEPLAEMRQVLKVLERYSKSYEQVVDLYYADGESRSFHLLAVILYLLHDYYEYGVYVNSEDVTEINGEGEIVWEKTIGSCVPLIRENRPYYTELYTRHTDYDDMDYFKRLHEYILTECSRQLRDAQIEDLFDLEPVELSDARRDDFGEKDYILERIMAELGVQFQTHRQILLKTMYAYIAQDQKLLDDEHGICMYGTNAFHMVWEKVCADVFHSQLLTPLDRLTLSVPVSEEFREKKHLMDLIEKPFWQTMRAGAYAKETLRPDMIAVGHANGVDYFIILDAKYYHIRLAEELDVNGSPGAGGVAKQYLHEELDVNGSLGAGDVTKQYLHKELDVNGSLGAGDVTKQYLHEELDLNGCPGVGDVTKQYMYELAYRQFIEAHGIQMVRNCFVMPTEKNYIQKIGTVSLSMMGRLGLGDIQVCLVHAGTMYEHYLSGTYLEFSSFLQEMYKNDSRADVKSTVEKG